MLQIDGEWYNVPVIALSRKADFLDKYASRTEDGVLQRELIGVFFNYQLKLGSTGDTAEYDRLWRKLTQPKEFHSVTVPGTGGDYTFTAYFSGVKDSLLREIPRENRWTGLTVNFIARSPVTEGYP
ncbi:MAG: hypothetical protein RRY54_08115 [Angelakisella sp.]